MRWLERWRGLARQTHLEELARRIAQVSAGEVAARFGERIAGMRTAEARGYVRARARATVERHWRATPEHATWHDERFGRAVVEAALDRTATRVLRQRMTAAPPISRRRAA